MQSTRILVYLLRGTDYPWTQDGVTLEYVISEIKSRYATQCDQHGNPWEITKIEKYKGDDSECQLDWLLIVRYAPVAALILIDSDTCYNQGI